MKKVLIISYYFPPNEAIGGLRIRGLSKYLPSFGWESVILTVDVQGDISHENDRVIRTPYNDVLASWKKRLGFKNNQSIKKQLGSSTKKNKKTLIDIPLDLFSEVLYYPDAQKGWTPYALEAARRILSQEKFDAIISSSNPVTCHLIARQLNNEFKIPWIADFRDLWTQNHYYPRSILRKFVERRLELATLTNANALVTVSKPLAENMGRLHKRKVYNVPNGFDPDNLKYTRVDFSNKFTITHTGVLYSGKRDPSTLFQAIKELIDEGKLDSRDIDIKFYGPQEDWMENEIKRYGLNQIVCQYGSIPRELVLDKQRESQILLLLLWNHPEEVANVTGKIFEYFAAKRPILAIGGPPKGVIKDLLEQTKTGEYSSNVEEIKKFLEKFYNDYKSKGLVEYHGINSEINKYNHIEMARKFGEILDHTIRHMNK